MKKMRGFGLSTQIILFFTIITLVTSIMFFFIFRGTVNNYNDLQAIKHHQEYHTSAKDVLEKGGDFASTSYYLTVYITKDVNNNTIIEKSNETFVIEDHTIIDNMILKFDGTYMSPGSGDNKAEKVLEIQHEGPYAYLIQYVDSDPTTIDILITISNGTYGEAFREPISNIISVGFISIVILGNAIIFIWSNLLVVRIKGLKNDVLGLSKNNYETEISADGYDEITDLSKVIENMRIEIYKNELVKTEMLQNISHDFKTPIAVIKSYAEAIAAGITGIEDAATIIKQADILSHKVKQLLEWNKLEYIKSSDSFIEVNMKDLITNVANNHKHYINIAFELDLDDSIYMGIKDNYYSMLNNIIENSLRYANSLIRITLNN